MGWLCISVFSGHNCSAFFGAGIWRTGVWLCNYFSGYPESALVPDFFGFRIPEEFVVGYGLDYNDEFRHLPYVGIPDADDLHLAVSG